MVSHAALHHIPPHLRPSRTCPNGALLRDCAACFITLLRRQQTAPSKTHFTHDSSSCHSVIISSSQLMKEEAFLILHTTNAWQLFRRLWMILLFSPRLLKPRVQWNNCAHRPHTHILSITPLTDWNFFFTCVSSPTRPPLLQNTEHMQRQQLVPECVSAHHLRGSIQCRLCRHSSLRYVLFFVFFWCQIHFICNIFLLVKSGSGLTQVLTSVRVLSLCWEANRAFFFLWKLLTEVKFHSQQKNKRCL